MAVENEPARRLASNKEPKENSMKLVIAAATAAVFLWAALLARSRQSRISPVQQ